VTETPDTDWDRVEELVFQCLELRADPAADER